ncbi:MAG: histone [Dehalococcoidales bacterium]|jgi:histone H3/H4
MSETTFPLAAIVRLMKANGIERVSREAAIEFDKKLSAIGTGWSKQIKLLTTHAKRKTAKPEDVKIATE